MTTPTQAPEEDDDDYKQIICPVTGSYCDGYGGYDSELCESYGCARVAMGWKTP